MIGKTQIVFCCLRSVAVVAALTVTSLAGAKKTDATDSAYTKLVKQVSAGDLSVDFRALRLACANASACDARGDNKDLTAMQKAFQAGKYEKAAEMGEKLIASGFPNIEAHAACARAYAGLKVPEKAEFHQAVTSALIKSILSTGDGKTKETAFEVIGTYEEHIILTVLGLPPFGKQSLISGKPHSYDLIEVDNPKTGEKVAVYFNIDAFFPMKGL